MLLRHQIDTPQGPLPLSGRVARFFRGPSLTFKSFVHAEATSQTPSTEMRAGSVPARTQLRWSRLSSKEMALMTVKQIWPEASGQRCGPQRSG